MPSDQFFQGLYNVYKNWGFVASTAADVASQPLDVAGHAARDFIRSEGGLAASAYALSSAAGIPFMVAKAFLKQLGNTPPSLSGSHRTSKGYSMRARNYSGRSHRRTRGRRSFGRRKSYGRRKYGRKRTSRQVIVDLARMFKKNKKYSSSYSRS